MWTKDAPSCTSPTLLVEHIPPMCLILRHKTKNDLLLVREDGKWADDESIAVSHLIEG